MTSPRSPEESKVEVAKKQSQHLRGTIVETLASDASHFEEVDKQLLKFHGTYEQDDRDTRRERRAAGEEKEYIFMVRCAIPGGVMSGEQYLAMDDLVDQCANGALRITSRQGLQFHGVVKTNLKATIAGINQSLLTTLSACGDVERNVMVCPAPLPDDAHVVLRATARAIAAELRPKSGAYHEIWLDGEKALSTEEEEPFYGDAYLPRKFKTGITVAGDNSIDIYTYDAGLIAIVENGRIIGYNLLAGGGLGMTHNKPDTFAALAQHVGFIGPDHAVEAVKALAAVFRDHGNRADRRHARLKYLLAERGIEWFRREFRSRVRFELQPWRELPRPYGYDYLGKNPQEGGKWFYGMYVQNGRITDVNGTRPKTALRKIAQDLNPAMVLTPNQNVLFTDLDEQAADAIETTLRAHGIVPAEEMSGVRRFSMACPALPTCGLAMAESERIMPSVVDSLEEMIESLGLREDAISVRMTGCPNGCSRPYNCDVGLVGRKPDVYHVYVGGGIAGDRMSDLYAADVHVNDLNDTLRPLLSSWSKHRNNGEGLSDYYRRVLGQSELRQTITGKEDPTLELVQVRLEA